MASMIPMRTDTTLWLKGPGFIRGLAADHNRASNDVEAQFRKQVSENKTMCPQNDVSNVSPMQSRHPILK